jgi:long-chain fatty acid transport protein
MRARILALSAAVTLTFGAHVFGQGFVLPSVGPVNGSMGGAGTAAPLDATGALHWNPASITGLPSSRFDVGVQLVANQNRVNSTLVVPVALSGSTDSEVGVWALPSIGLVYRDQESPWAYGLGLNAIGGFFTNYPASTTNPLFTPPPVGVGPVYSRFSILQLAPTLAVEVIDGLSIGVAPTIDIADAQANPFLLTAPNANGYPPAIGNRNRWGVGAQAGLFYETAGGLNLGFSVKSPQWFERFEFNTTDAVGLPREASTQVEYPMILSWGAAYGGLQNVLLAVDVRWIDYASTEVFGEPVSLTPTGALRGLGWDSIWAVAFGAQFELTERLTFRCGYSYNENPVPPGKTMFSVFAPGIFQHVVSAGASLQLTRSVIGSLTYIHGFDNTVNGPILAGPALTPVPLSKVSLSQSIDSVMLGVGVVF